MYQALYKKTPLSGIFDNVKAQTVQKADEKLHRAQSFWADATDYDSYIRAELSGFRAEAWLNLLHDHLPKGSLDILDIGTGPGFFPCILAPAGYRVVGIDTSENMLNAARRNTTSRGYECRFEKMDAHVLAFPDESFDVIISRNVTWTLFDPEKAYAEWFRVLKPGGVVLIYDANWHLEFYDDSIAQQVRENEMRHAQRYGEYFKVCNDDKPYYDSLPLSSIKRPNWDVEVLHTCGYENIAVRNDIGAQVYERWEYELYGASPLFEICASKPKKSNKMDGASSSSFALSDESRQVKEYWEDRASSFGLDGENIDAWGSLLNEHIPSSVDYVVDVGCGTGAMTIPLAKRGHEVIALDLCENMIRRAKENLIKRGLSARFYQASAENLPFDRNSVPALVSRNVLSNLVDPQGALQEWCDILQPGGILVYFDSAWWHYLYDDKLDSLRQAFYGSGSSPTFSILEAIADKLPLSDKVRPDWDRVFLENAGMDVLCIRDVSSVVWTKEEQLKHSFAPQFMVVARKPFF